MGPVGVEVYIDLASPFCRQFELMAAPTLDRLLADRLISSIRYPMNVLDAAVSAVAYSTRAAAASGGGRRCDVFHEYARALFEHQPTEGGPGLTDGQLVELGQAVGATDPQFAETIRRGTYPPWPASVTQRAFACRVAGMPSFCVRGVVVAVWPGPIFTAVEAALA